MFVTVWSADDNDWTEGLLYKLSVFPLYNKFEIDLMLHSFYICAILIIEYRICSKVQFSKP